MKIAMMETQHASSSLFKPRQSHAQVQAIFSQHVAAIMRDVVASAPLTVSEQDKYNMLALIESMLVSGMFRQCLRNLPVEVIVNKKPAAVHLTVLKILESLLPVGVLLSLIPKTQANNVAWQAKDGVPVGGDSLCVNKLISCFDLYFVREMQDWTIADPQANRQIVSLITGMGNSAPFMALNMLEACLNKTAVGDLVVGALQASNNTLVTGNCMAYGDIFQNWNASSNVLAMPVDSCPLYKDAFAARVKLCSDQEALTANTGMIVGICVGVICLLLLGIAGIQHFRKKQVDFEENLIEMKM